MTPTMDTILNDLHAIQRAALSRGTPACDHLAARIEGVRNQLRRVVEPGNGALCVRLGAFDININLSDEGVVVDVCSGVDDTQMEPLATCYAFDVDALPEEHSDE